MRIRTAPLGFVTGGTLSPEVLNENLGHMSQSIDEVVSYRYAHHVVRLPYFRDLSTPYTEADSDEFREYVINLPTRWSVERAYLRYYGTAADTVRVDVYEGASLLVGEYLTIPAQGSEAAASDFAGQRISCSPDTEYRFRLASAGAFSSSGTYLELHIRADRLNTDGTDVAPTYGPPRIKASDARDAGVFSDELDDVDDAIDTLEGATTYTKAEVYVAHGLASSGSVTWRLPQVDSDVTKRHLARIAIRIVLASGATTDTAAVATVRDAGGVKQEDIVAGAFTGSTSGSAAADVSEDISEAVPDLSDPSNDWTLTLSHDKGDTITKAYVVLVYS